MKIKDVAILAPVPLEHLRSGAEIADETGFVAFGSRKWELYRQVDHLRGGVPVPVLIYPSHEDMSVKVSSIVSWAGWYIGCEESGSGRHSMGMSHRPTTTGQYASDNKGHWAVFWHVRGLRELPTDRWLPISAIQTIEGGWRKSAPPRGPELVAMPSAMELLL